MNELMREINNHKNEFRDRTEIYMNHCGIAIKVVDDMSQYIKIHQKISQTKYLRNH